VLATLHTSSAAQTVDRIVDVFPPIDNSKFVSNSLPSLVAGAQPNPKS
jgi:Tfp pilus assembly pilus retraction ATPase PilT